MTEASQVSTTPAIEPTCTPDAALIRLCAEHAVNRDAFNADTSRIADDATNPLALAFHRSNRAVSAAVDATPPRSMPGLRALARVAIAEPDEQGWISAVLQGVVAMPQGVA